MLHLIHAEHRKSAHTLGKKLPFLLPALDLLLAFWLTGGRGDSWIAGAWNWWYIMFFPGMLAIFCYLCVKKDKKIKYYHVFTVQYDLEKSWLAKIVYCAFGMLASNLFIFLGIWVGGILFGMNVMPFRCLAGALLLCITYAWSIPLFLFLSDRYGMFASVFVGIALPMASVFTVADGNFWWIFPPSIPIRLMCPVLGILPNGLPVEPGSTMGSGNVIFPGTVLSVLWFLLLTVFTSIWFRKREVGA